MFVHGHSVSTLAKEKVWQYTSAKWLFVRNDISLCYQHRAVSLLQSRFLSHGVVEILFHFYYFSHWGCPQSIQSRLIAR